MKPRKDAVLAKGEATGHAHRAISPTARVFGEGIDRELHAPGGTGIKHEEHLQLEIPPGEFDVSQQMEIDPDTEEARSVID